MNFEVRATPRFERDLKGLPREVQVRIAGALRRLELDPHRGKRLGGALEDTFSLRVGSYRVLYEIEGAVVMLHAVGHRKAVYR